MVYRVFMRYLVNEFVIENLLFYTEVIRRRDSPLVQVLTNAKKKAQQKFLMVILLMLCCGWRWLTKKNDERIDTFDN